MFNCGIGNFPMLPSLIFWVLILMLDVRMIYSLFLILLPCSLVHHFDIYLFVAELIVDSIVECGAVPALLKHLKVPEPGVTKPYEHEVEGGYVLVLALLAYKVIQHFSVPLHLSISLSQDLRI